MKLFKVKRTTLKTGFFCVFVPLMFPAKQLQAQASGYNYEKTITIQASKVSGTNTNFPVLISLTSNSLKSTANGGHVQNASGYDILFTLGDCGTVLSHQIESYDPVAGQLVAWVKIPSLPSTSNTTLYMFYGKSTVSTNPSTTAVWDANYMGVYHFNSSVNDATSNGKNLTDNSTADLSGSKIGNGRRLNNNPFVTSASSSLQYLQLPNNMFSSVADFSFEGWVWIDAATTSWERIFDFGRNTTFNMFLCPSIGNATTGIKRFAITKNGNGAEQQISSATSTSTAAWHYFVVTINNSNNTGTLYYDGASNASNASMTLRPDSLGADNSNYFGRSQYTADEGLYGNFDEFRLSNTVRNANWITTSYNNQNSPSTFFTVAAEVGAATICSTLPLKLTAFDATASQSGGVNLTWFVQQQPNDEKFIVERSSDGTSWQAIKSIQAANTVNGSQKYTVQDADPLYPVSYYRLKIVDVDNSFTYSETQMVKLNTEEGNFLVSPNPVYRNINIALKQNITSQNIHVELLNTIGVKIPVQPAFGGNNISMEIPGLANGIYFLNVYINGTKYSRKLLIVQ